MASNDDDSSSKPRIFFHIARFAREGPSARTFLFCLIIFHFDCFLTPKTQYLYGTDIQQHGNDIHTTTIHETETSKSRKKNPHTDRSTISPLLLIFQVPQLLLQHPQPSLHHLHLPPQDADLQLQVPANPVTNFLIDRRTPVRGRPACERRRRHGIECWWRRPTRRGSFDCISQVSNTENTAERLTLRRATALALTPCLYALRRLAA